MTMKSIFSIFTVILLTTSIKAQVVSTLVSDSTRSFESIHWHSDGRIYSVDYANGRVYQVQTNGVVTTLVQGILGAVGGGFDSNGNFYFCSVASNNVYRLNANNTTTIVGSGFDQPIAVLPTDHPDTLLVTEYDGNRVSKLSISTGVRVNWVSGGGLNGPDAIIYNDQDEIIVANFNNPNLFKIINGSISLFATLPVSGFMGYCINVNDNIYVPSLAGNQIFRVNAAGAIISIAGSGSNGYDDGPAALATFSSPNGICTNPAGDTLLITDGSRIRVLTGFDETSGLNSQEKKESIPLYYNNVTNELRVFSNGLQQEVLNWSIFDSSGKKVRSNSGDTITDQHYFDVNVSTFKSGVYYFHLFEKEKFIGVGVFVI